MPFYLMALPEAKFKWVDGTTESHPVLVWNLPLPMLTGGYALLMVKNSIAKCATRLHRR